METRNKNKKVTFRKRLRQMRKGFFHCLRLAYAMPETSPKKYTRTVEGLPTWRFDLTVVVFALVLGIPLLFK